MKPIEDDRTLACEWFPSSNLASRAPANQVLREHDRDFKEKLARASAKVKDELGRLVETKNQKKIEGTLKRHNGEELSELLAAMSLEDLSAYVSTQVAGVNSAQAGLTERRSKGIHKSSAKATKFVSEFDRFLTAYSGIVNVVTLADSQYGGVACATLALLFSTVMMKVKDEEAITSAMQQMSDRLPDFAVYQKIYPDSELGLMLVDAYKDVILLAREATSYFMGSTLGRQLHSLGKPLQFEMMEQSMRNNFSRIRLKCETLLAQRVDRLLQELEGMQKRMDSSMIVDLRNSLDLGHYRPDEAVQSLREYRELLASIFDNDRRRTKLRVEDVMAHEAGRFWQESGSCLFMLSGRNEPGVSSTKSWLSPTAVDLTLALLNETRRVAFEVCDESSTLASVLSRLIFQLLEMNPAIVRKADEWYSIQSLITRHGAEREEALAEALLKVIKLQKEPVFIVLDRPELSEENSVTDFASTILPMVEQTEKSLKVLIVHRAELWNWEENKRGIVRQGMSPERCRTLRFDQERL